MKKIYITIEDDWAARWVKCSKFHGHRSALLRKWFKKLVMAVEAASPDPTEVKVEGLDEPH